MAEMVEKIGQVDVRIGSSGRNFPVKYSKSCKKCKLRNERCKTDFDSSVYPYLVKSCKLADIILETLGRFPEDIKKVGRPLFSPGYGPLYIRAPWKWFRKTRTGTCLIYATLFKGNEDLTDIIHELESSCR